MPRRPRLLIEGGLYHFYNRCSRGEPVFGDPQEAIEFVELIRAVKERDGLTVYAWALLSNHFHLALRTSVVSLSRTMKFLQGSYSRAFNRRWRRTGPLWQSRYQAKLVKDQRYFNQLMVYIHLNPVRAGLAEDPAEYVFSGHRELLGRVQSPLVDMDEALLGFGRTLRGARRGYLNRMKAALAEGDSPQGLLSPPRQAEGDLDRGLKPGRAHVDELGRSFGLERPPLEAGDFLELACKILGTDMERLAGTRRDSDTARLRMLVVTVGIERWGQRAGVLATALQKHPDGLSRWVNRGARLRGQDVSFAQATAELDKGLSRTALKGLRRETLS